MIDNLRPAIQSPWVGKARALADSVLSEHAADVDQKERYPDEGFAAIAASGICGISVPKKFGGIDLPASVAVAVVEELSRGCSATGALMLTWGGSVLAIREYGTPAQQEKWLPGVASGKLALSFALTEPGAGSDAAAIVSSAEKVDGGWRLNGVKCWIGNASMADVIVAAFKTDPQAGAHGITSFLLGRNMPGLTIGALYSKLGVRGARHSDVVFESVMLPDDALLGSVGGGFSQMMHSLDFVRLLTAAHAVGIAQSAFEAATSFAADRTTFGKRLHQHQSISFLIADMATQIHAARVIVRDAAAALDSGKRAPTEAAMAKLFATEMATKVAHGAVQIHGASGCLSGHVAERAYRDARVTEIWDGTSEIQRLVIGRAIMGRWKTPDGLGPATNPRRETTHVPKRRKHVE